MLTGAYAGEEKKWIGEITRTAGGLDERSRMISLVAEVEDPFGILQGDSKSAPLQVGAFVKASIAGIERKATFTVPRSAILFGSQMMLVDDKNLIQFRSVEVIQYVGEEAVIGSGLNDGDIVCVTSLEIPKEGVLVQPKFPNNEERP